MTTRTSIAAWILSAFGDFVGFEKQRVNALSKIYVAKLPCEMRRA